MFGLLKNKLSNFTKKLKEKTISKKEIKEEIPLPEEEPEVGEEKETPPEPKIEEPEIEEPLAEPEPVKEPIEKIQEPEPIKEEQELEEPVKPELVEEKPEEEEVEPEPIEKKPEIEQVEEPVKPEIIEEEKEPIEIKPKEIPKPEPKIEKKPSIEKRELKTKIKAKSKVKSFFKRYVELTEADLKDLLYELELSLLESDVNHDSAQAICEKIRTDLVGKRIPKGADFDSFIKKEIKKILTEIMQTEKISLLPLIKSKKEKPFVILFLGPNGSGKTTSIAKLTHFLQENNLQVIWSASDTFRAASIEQLEKHASNLNIRVVKHSYGSDPAAVAFDAIEAAKAKGIDVVLIDSAGRQETNKNLMEELKKIERVAKPDLKLFVGEALAGKSLLEQARTYNEFLPLDGFILTKIDTDTKGGTAISLLHELKKPILYIGTGQHYKDLEEFTSEYILDRIV